MEKGFDINEIEVKDSNKNIEKLLTGDVETGLQKGDPRKPNAEIEGGEYIKLPQGNVKKAEGPKHTQGGIKTNLPENTEVISDSIYLTKSEVLKLEKEFEVNLSTKDTYATALDKYSKKIGLKKLNDEQEDIISLLKKEIEKKSVDKGTSLINNEYLSNKIYDIESKKKPLEDKRKKFFDKVFDIQESKKKQENKEGEFKFGGVQEQAFQNLLKKHNMSEDEGRRILSGLPKFADGGEFIKRIEAGEDPNAIYKDLRNSALNQTITEQEYRDILNRYYQKYPETNTASSTENARLRGTYVNNEFKNEDRVYQKANQTNYGTEKDPQTILTNLYQNFPDIISDEKVFGKYIDKEALKNGEIKFKDNLPLNQEQAAVLEFQKRADKRMRASANDIIKNPNDFSEETVKKAQSYLKDETFLEDQSKAKTEEERIRLYDRKMGNFTSGRYSLKLDLVTPEESDLLKSKGIYTANQITPEILSQLSQESQDRVNRLKKIKSEDSDYNINVYTPEKEKPSPQTEGDIKEDIDLSTKQKRARAFYSPDQSVLPPGGQQPEMLVNNRFQRIDPIRIGIESQLQSGAENRNFLASQIDFLPPAQRAAALSSLLSTTQSAENEAILGTNITNAQNISAAEQFNIGQSDRENIAQGSNLLNFEGRSLTAKAKTEADLREYLKYNHNVAMNKFSNDQQLNLISNLTPDYALDYYGMGVNYDPYYDFQIKNNDQLNRLGLGPTNTTEQSVDEEV